MRYIRQLPARNEDGLVALLVVAIMILLLSLTTVAFTKLMSRESRQALDRVLSTQAYYAAESGINDARDYLSKHPNATLAGTTCNTLANLGYPPYLGQSPTDGGDVDKITCVVADTSPDQLTFQIPSGRTRIFEMSSTNPINDILFSWDNSTVAGGGYCANNYKVGGTALLTNGAWNSASGCATASSVAPVLEVSYYSLPDSGTNLSNQISGGRTIYLYPQRRGTVGASTYSNASQPDAMIVNNSCQASPDLSGSFPGANPVNHCNTIISPSPAQNHVFIKVTAIYGSAALTVRASSAGGPIAIDGAQAILDATGRGGPDVLKRLQTIVDYRPTDPEPGYAVESVSGLCKRLEYNLTTNSVIVDHSEDPSDPLYDPNTSPACAIN